MCNRVKKCSIGAPTTFKKGWEYSHCSTAFLLPDWGLPLLYLSILGLQKVSISVIQIALQGAGMEHPLFSLHSQKCIGLCNVLLGFISFAQASFKHTGGSVVVCSAVSLC